jgi:signal transduction histidine kinase
MKSLTAKLVFALVTSQFLAILLAMVIFPLFAPFVTYRDIAEQTLRSLALASLSRQADGTLSLSPGAALNDYMSERPGLALAVIDLQRNKVLFTSDPQLADVARISPYYPELSGNLKTRILPALGDYVMVSTEDTRFGPLAVVSSGNQFGWSDLGSFFVAFLPAMMPIYGPVVLGAAVLLPLFISRALRPITAIRNYADRIDANSLSEPLRIENAPREFAPLIGSLNAALSRIEAGFKRQKAYAANAAHELRTPITILAARADRLPHGPDVTELKADVQRITLIVEQLLTAARLNQQTGQGDAQIDLIAAARNVVASFAPLAIERGRAIAFLPEVEHLPVTANALSVGSAISNLVDNALRLEPPGGTVEVSVKATGCVEVCDHGPGFDSADAAAMFEAFWQRDPSSTGAGLGLAIVKDVAERYGGAVDARLRPGGGACFSICIPPAHDGSRDHAAARQSS